MWGVRLPCSRGGGGRGTGSGRQLGWFCWVSMSSGWVVEFGVKGAKGAKGVTGVKGVIGVGKVGG